ncbi:PLP-dependent aminotransferase family protein [Bacillus sp. FJAT-42376]|uniref:MocR-like pyridoxine biosynthesis transcription factor PdxR n=1 Tax=Bacillus sp. FJAT-42376 TaxID=2014076 RepID=UPI000F502D51|nr:PLP-dependent aminotransferase family protein [Bacillus sp. FJAT-42376]AZB42147.1 PLP-dependent aminotransferase family protein [Bacillus sp. FJAT-42376]
MDTIFFREGSPLFVQLYEQIKQSINDGTLASDSKLPSKRKLSLQLNISVNTVESAYAQLEAEGYIEARPRKGWYVLHFENTLFSHPSSLQEKNEDTPVQPVIDFSQTIDTDKFPYAQWKKCSVEALHKDELFHTGHLFGEKELREEIAAYLFRARGVRCHTDQVIIGAGTHILLEKAARILGAETFAIEDPGYHRTRDSLKDYSLIPIPLDESGMDIKALKSSNATAVYITPSHQFPYGTVMPVKRRLELLEWAAEETNRWIIEDDYDGEFRYEGRPIPSLQSLSQNEDVLYFGTFSKSFIPSLRISYMILPEKLMRSAEPQLMAFKQTVSRFHQHALSLFMARGFWEQHLNRMRTHYRKKHSLLIRQMQAVFQDRIRIIGEKSGMHILIQAENGMSEEELITAAGRQGVKVYPASLYFVKVKPEKPLLFIGFGGVTEEEIVVGIELLRRAWF